MSTQNQHRQKDRDTTLEYALQRARDWRHRTRESHQREQKLLTELGTLHQRLVAIEAERDAARHQLRALENSLANAALRQAPRARRPAKAHQRAVSRLTSAAGVVLLLGGLASSATLRDQQDDVAAHSPPVMLASVEAQAEPAQRAPAGKAARDARHARPSQSLRDSIRRLGYRGSPRPAHRQWGPLLLLPEHAPAKAARHGGFDPLVKAQQQNLLDLGFDLGQAKADGLKGARTERALQEFQSLYLSAAGPQTALPDADLAFLIGVYANLAREDASNYNIDRGVLAAIRLSSVRTGVEFSYLMELAAAESNFNPVAQASGSSALGLYQFTHDTWLNTIKDHGEKYGLASYASQIEYVVDRGGKLRPLIRNADVYQHVLDLRRNPRVSAMMAAESVKDNLKTLSAVFDHAPARTDLYLTHFLGPGSAVSFLNALNENPGTFAVDLFPEAAESNHSIFHPQTCKPRTVAEVYEVFSQKFHASRYGEHVLN